MYLAPCFISDFIIIFSLKYIYIYIKNNIFLTYLLNISLSSCSETNWPKLATNKVEQGALLTAIFGCDDEEPTGDANAGDGKKCGNEACIDVNVVGCCKDIWAC